MNKQEQTMEEKLELRQLFFIRPSNLDDANDVANKGMNIVDNIVALAVQQRDEEILQKAKDILDKESEYYGTDKHGLSYEQLEYIIKAINQD